MIYKSGLSKKKFTDCPYDFSLSISWWYIKLLLNANYIPHRSLYTLIKILPCVCCKMNFKCTIMWESLLTLGASKWFLASVSNLMHHKCNTLWKRHILLLAFNQFSTTCFLKCISMVFFTLEINGTLVTLSSFSIVYVPISILSVYLIRALPSVSFQMHFKCTIVWESLVTLGASKWFLATVSHLINQKFLTMKNTCLIVNN